VKIFEIFDLPETKSFYKFISRFGEIRNIGFGRPNTTLFCNEKESRKEDRKEDREEEEEIVLATRLAAQLSWAVFLLQGAAGERRIAL
jgi:hypothetical protein